MVKSPDYQTSSSDMRTFSPWLGGGVISLVCSMLRRSIMSLEFVYGQNVMDGLSSVLAHALFVSQNRNAHKPVRASFVRSLFPLKIISKHLVGYNRLHCF